jgi:signal transduction histidine kinase
MSRFRTLRGRLTAFAVLATAVALGLMVVVFNVVLVRNLDGAVRSSLRAQAAAAATTVSAREGRLTIRESPDDQAIDAQVWVFEGRLPVLRAPARQPVQRAAAGLAGRAHVFRDVDGEVRLYALPIIRGGRQVGTVVAGESLEAYDRTTDAALIGTVALAVLVLLAVGAVAWWTIGRALDPVRDMTRTAAQWSEHDADRRFGVAHRPDELGELAATFDALLDRLAASLRHEQRLSAELSHELRTPLARILAEMDLLQRRERSGEERRAAYEVVTRSVDQMSRVLEMLMAAARAESRGDLGRGDLGEAFEALAATWGAPLAERGVDLVLTPGPRTVGVDADVVERIVGPLLDNASRYARSRVTVEAVRAAGRVQVSVRDDGPGLAADEAEDVFEPGVRGRQANGHPGAGLGLALARRLARAVDGDVTVAGEPGSGATFVVDLPA